MVGGLLLLLGDIATVLGDIAVMSKVATKNSRLVVYEQIVNDL